MISNAQYCLIKDDDDDDDDDDDAAGLEVLVMAIVRVIDRQTHTHTHTHRVCCRVTCYSALPCSTVVVVVAVVAL